MSISEIQSRVQSIQARLSNPPMAGRVAGAFEAQLAAATASIEPAPVADSSVEASAEGFSVRPQAAPDATSGGQLVTLGMMLGLTATPATISASGTVFTSAELAAYMDANNIEARNGRLSMGELREVSGGWFGTGYLLPPAASAWEEMRSAALSDGIDLQATDFYRSWESQNNAYHAHLRGEKAANVLPPGTSEHGNGLAVDITNGSIIGHDDPEHAWLRTHAAAYGWYPISNESWHWEFRGTSI